MPFADKDLRKRQSLKERLAKMVVAIASITSPAVLAEGQKRVARLLLNAKEITRAPSAIGSRRTRSSVRGLPFATACDPSRRERGFSG
jgi:hypothetical protein